MKAISNRFANKKVKCTPKGIESAGGAMDILVGTHRDGTFFLFLFSDVLRVESAGFTDMSTIHSKKSGPKNLPLSFF